MIPNWLYWLSIGSLVLAALYAVLIALDVMRHSQNMWIMNVVWPVAALFGSLWIVWQYFTYGREIGSSPEGRNGQTQRGMPKPLAVMVAHATLHCGAGCTLGDILAEWLVRAVPAVAVVFGYPGVFHDQIFVTWTVDYLFAFSLGILFQYFTIAPMCGLSLGEGLVAALKADVLSLTAWQFGMYGFIAITHFIIFPMAFGARLTVDTPEFWFIMQIAMLFGFAAAYPVNWLLLRDGLKEKM